MKEGIRAGLGSCSLVRYLWPMLLTRAEMTFDFHGARLDCGADQALLAWMMNQFL